ncbi:MAG: pyruvate carboxylase subunit B [Planctomycetes bacterium]|nr:pyruvate carboxylase subunit B [Planctomycetota bacterium]
MAGSDPRTGARPAAAAHHPVKIMDTTFRDGHQSLFATRMRTEDMEPIAEAMNRVGFSAMEVWGGATFDVATRFLNEDPWERVRVLKRLMPDTPLQMLLRGQNLVGYRNYADDVVAAFCEHAAEVGIDIFRVFDALNDERNVEASYRAIAKAGKHIQGTICYSLTQPRLGGEVFHIDYFVEKAKILRQMGAHSICIKDMAGLCAPLDAYDLVTALKAALDCPVELHTHYTSGMGAMSLLKAVEAGVDIIDTALAPWAERTSQPACEPIVAALRGTDRDPGLDLERLFEIGRYLESIAPKYRRFLAMNQMAVIDTGVLSHQIPGGMTSNLIAQLKEADALDRLREVHEELPRVRQELGYPPLVTPTSQIVGTQAVFNVLHGRYKMVSAQVKDYLYGLYGRPPAPVDEAVRREALAGYERGQEPITCRPGDVLEPELAAARAATRGVARDVGDVLCYALYPQTGLRFLRWKYGREEVPGEAKPLGLEEARRREQLAARALAGQLETPEAARPVEIATTKAFQGNGDGQVVIGEGEVAVTVPMPGTVIRFNVEVGDTVREGDTVALLEAMKMENAIVAPADGVIKSLHFDPGTLVRKSDVLAVITSG